MDKPNDKGVEPADNEAKAPADERSYEEKMLDELRQIRIAVSPKPTELEGKGFFNEFRLFIGKYKIFGLAVAFVLGIYSGALIAALVTDLIMPIIQLIVPGTAWETIALGPFMIGHFISVLVTFVIVVLIIFLLVKLTKRYNIE